MPDVVVAGIRYAYIEAGSGPLLLFAHGTFGAKEAFAHHVAHLSARFRCVSVDLPGHGGSGYDRNGWDIDDLVRAVPELILALGEQKAALAGVSQGGAIFMRAALAYPEKVSALVIMCAGPATPPPALLKALKEFATLLCNEMDEDRRRKSARRFLAAFHAPTLVEAHDAGIEAELAQVLRHPRYAMPLVAEVPASYRPIFDMLPQLSCPTLVIWGENDFRPSLGREIAAQIPHAQLRVIQAAGHHVHVDAPEATATAIEEFLSHCGAFDSNG
jgi:pimeloyl-ACP methyl ester carboxylesterase